jgi:hypothetical protein
MNTQESDCGFSEGPITTMAGKTEENNVQCCSTRRDSSEAQKAILKNRITLKTDTFVGTF